MSSLSISPEELFRGTSVGTRSGAHQEVLDPERLTRGDRVSFIYTRGSHVNRRELVFERTSLDGGKYKVYCSHEEDGIRVEKSYYVSGCVLPLYHQDEGSESESGDGGDGRGVALEIPETPRTSGYGRPAAQHVRRSNAIDRAKAALPLADHSVDGPHWKASAAWKTQQRRPGHGVLEEGQLLINDKEEIYTELKSVIENAQEELMIVQYEFDHEVLTEKICEKVRQGVHVRFIVDRRKFERSSCVHMAERVAQCFQAGVDLRTHLPPKGKGWASCHLKCVTADRRVMLTGSVNMTTNGIQNNVEQVVRLTDAMNLERQCEFFARLWEEAKPVTPEDMDRVLGRKADSKEKEEAKKAEKKHQQSAASSSSLRAAAARGPTKKGPGTGT
jgi:HKD family nuclease